MLTQTFEAMDGWTRNLEVLTANVKAAVRELRRDGTVSMSRENFRQVASTRGVDVAPAQFDRLLDQAIERAHVHSYIR